MIGRCDLRVLGLDIGGANIKAATFDGESVSVSFPIWQDKELLAVKLKELTLLRDVIPDLVALTMTAELADCFETKAEGVKFIIRTVCDVFSESLVRVWLTSGEFAEPEDAIDLPQLVAAANWHALATWAGRAVPKGPAILIDVGSTTTDVIPLFDGVPVPEGFTDLHRLLSSELLYTGVRRTPICAIVQTVPLLDEMDPALEAERMLPLAAEHFATSLDMHLLNEDIPQDPHDVDTADGRPATRAAAMNRLAHMICSDIAEVSENQLMHIAGHIAGKQLEQICRAVRNRAGFVQQLAASDSPEPQVRVLLSGSGAWLAERAVQEIGESAFESVSSLSGMFVRNVAACAPAFAVARLAAERCTDDLLPVVPW
jgi:probable H4MPT-linked C1 transfer pathway protein